MKPIEYWLKKLPKGYRELALAARKKETDKNPIEVDSFSRAIDVGFWWDKTEQGSDFWREVLAWVRHKENSPELPSLQRRKTKKKTHKRK